MAVPLSMFNDFGDVEKSRDFGTKKIRIRGTANSAVVWETKDTSTQQKFFS